MRAMGDSAGKVPRHRESNSPYSSGMLPEAAGQSAATIGLGARSPVLAQSPDRHLPASINISAHLRISQNISEHLRTSQNISEYLRTSQNISEHLRMSQNISECLRTSQNVSRHVSRCRQSRLGWLRCLPRRRLDMGHQVSTAPQPSLSRHAVAAGHGGGSQGTGAVVVGRCGCSGHAEGSHSRHTVRVAPQQQQLMMMQLQFWQCDAQSRAVTFATGFVDQFDLNLA
eukprot:SAG31_NODE_414_length_15953_cov_2.982528_12_plen_228_part_00